MFGGNQPATHHRRAPDPGAEGEHHDVIKTPRRARVPLAEQGQAGVILDHQRQAEFGARPAGEVERGAVVVFVKGFQDAVRAGFHDAGQAHHGAHVGAKAHAGLRGERADGGGQLGQTRRETPAGIPLQGAGGQHASGPAHDGAGGMTASEVQGDGVGHPHGRQPKARNAGVGKATVPAAITTGPMAGRLFPSPAGATTDDGTFPGQSPPSHA